MVIFFVLFRNFNNKRNGKRCLNLDFVLLLPRRNDNHEFVTVYSFDVETIKPQKFTKKCSVDGHHHRHLENLCDLYIQVIFHVLVILIIGRSNSKCTLLPFYNTVYQSFHKWLNKKDHQKKEECYTPSYLKKLLIWRQKCIENSKIYKPYFI